LLAAESRFADYVVPVVALNTSTRQSVQEIMCAATVSAAVTGCCRWLLLAVVAGYVFVMESKITPPD